MLVYLILLFAFVPAGHAEFCSDVFRPGFFRSSLPAKNASSFAVTTLAEAEFASLMEKSPALANRYERVVGEELKLRGTTERYRDLPFETTHRFRAPPAKYSSVLIQRYEKLDPALQRAIMTAYNVLNDPQTVSRYLKDLYVEAAVYTKRRNRLGEMAKLLKEGLVPKKAVAVTVIKRLKARGDNRFTRISKYNDKKNSYLSYGKQPVNYYDAANKNAAFRAAVSNGPFIDDALASFEHGAFSHLIQRDMVHKALSEVLGDDISRFYEYLGSRAGVALWADIFDAGNTVRASFSRPEDVTRIVFSQLSGS